MKEEIKRFMALAPLLLPSLIRENKLVGEEITENVSILHFNLDEELPITYVMDMLEDDREYEGLEDDKKYEGIKDMLEDDKKYEGLSAEEIEARKIDPPCYADGLPTYSIE